jgi:hypothetical protein
VDELLKCAQYRSGTFSLKPAFVLDIEGESADNESMFVREKSARGHTYLYLVENEREGGRICQRIIRALGRKDVLGASGELNRLAASLVRHWWAALVRAALGAARHCRGAGRARREPRF